MRIISDFSIETLKARKTWTYLTDHSCQPILLNSAKLPVTKNGENKLIYDKVKFVEYLSTNPVLQGVVEKNPTQGGFIYENTRNNLTAEKRKEGKHTK